MIIIQKDEGPEMRPMDIMQRIKDFLGRSDWYRLGEYITVHEYPIQCKICGAKTKGNVIIGYRMGCKEYHNG